MSVPNQDTDRRVAKRIADIPKNFGQKFESFRLYACGKVVHEDDWDEEDNSLPYYDDYGQYDIPVEIISHIAGEDYA